MSTLSPFLLVFPKLHNAITFTYNVCLTSFKHRWKYLIEIFDVSTFTSNIKTIIFIIQNPPRSILPTRNLLDLQNFGSFRNEVRVLSPHLCSIIHHSCSNNDHLTHHNKYENSNSIFYQINHSFHFLNIDIHCCNFNHTPLTIRKLSNKIVYKNAKENESTPFLSFLMGETLTKGFIYFQP
jgi:hypothetical protein